MCTIISLGIKCSLLYSAYVFLFIVQITICGCIAFILGINKFVSLNKIESLHNMLFIDSGIPFLRYRLRINKL